MNRQIQREHIEKQIDMSLGDGIKAAFRRFIMTTPNAHFCRKTGSLMASSICNTCRLHRYQADQ